MNKIFKSSLLLLATLSLSACMHEDTDDDGHMHDHDMATYKVTVFNITSNQPMTPPVAILHQSEYTLWSSGEKASVDLEKLAEGGDSSDIVTTAMASSYVATTATSANAPFGPGASESLTLETHSEDELYISVATMLANTNDAFSGVSAVKVSHLMSGESISMMTHAYDAGTEANSEQAGTIPGPADTNGEGFNATRETNDYIRIHPGVVTQDDGLATSVLLESHRWLGPVAKIVIEKM